MTKRDLIKKILELGKELEDANGFDAVMIINDMEIEVDNYTKQLPIHNVVGQSEHLCIIKEQIEESVSCGKMSINVSRSLLDMLNTELPDYELDYCENCIQMKNHLDGICQKCK
jgi:hypothetical protein